MFWSGYTEENFEKATEIFFSPLNLNEIPYIMKNKNTMEYCLYWKF